jgi:hypothetical protein
MQFFASIGATSLLKVGTATPEALAPVALFHKKTAAAAAKHKVNDNPARRLRMLSCLLNFLLFDYLDLSDLKTSNRNRNETR